LVDEPKEETKMEVTLKPRVAKKIGRSEQFKVSNPNAKQRWGKKDDIQLFKRFKEMSFDFSISYYYP
jgi:hypothetical protein